MRIMSLAACQVKLDNVHWVVEIVPKRGASLEPYEPFGFPIFEPRRKHVFEGGDVFALNCFPLSPYSNRVIEYEFDCEGRHCSLSADHPKQLYTIHRRSCIGACVEKSKLPDWREKLLAAHKDAFWVC